MKACKYIVYCLLALALNACRIDPPLHLRQTLDLEVGLELDLNVDLMWQIDWETHWEYHWNTEIMGDLGYEEPASVRMHAFAWGADDKIASYQVYNFMGTSGNLQAVAGMYDFLFHNNDSESLLFETGEDIHDIYAYTRVISSGLKESSPVRSLSQKLNATKADENEYAAADDPVVLEPDGLFSLYTSGRFISDDPKDYEFIDGRYVIRIDGTLLPADFIYLIQVRLLNNNGRIIGSSGGCVLTGMAGGVNLRNNLSGTTTVSVPAPVYVDRATDPDLMAARLISFGIPGCNAYDPASVAAAPAGEHFLVLSVSYNNGTYKNIHIDVTDQVRALPTGGVITLDLNVDDFPPEGGHEGEDSSFNALLNDWEEEVGSATIIY